MQYRCPISHCGMTTPTARDLAIHMVCTKTYSEKHRAWIEAQSIDYRIILAMEGKYYGPLIRAIESRCRTDM